MKKLCLTVLIASLLSTAVAGCGSESEAAPESLQDKIKVTGEYGAKPTIDIDEPLEFSESSSWTEQKGDGDKVGEGATAILQLTLANGRSGKTVISTFDQGQRPLELALGDQVFPSLVVGLTGKATGSRVVVASTSEDAYGEQGAPQVGIEGGDPVVMVADVLSTDPTSVLDEPSGEALPVPAGSPKLLQADGVPTGFDVTGLKKPKKLVVVPLIEGTGPAVEAPDRVAVDYLGQVWGAKKPFEESYSKDPARFSVGLGSVIPAWDQALVGVKEGGRVMLVAPPELAYGKEGRPGIPPNSTLVFVVDVLGVG